MRLCFGRIFWMSSSPRWKIENVLWIIIRMVLEAWGFKIGEARGEGYDLTVDKRLEDLWERVYLLVLNRIISPAC